MGYSNGNMCSLYLKKAGNYHSDDDIVCWKGFYDCVELTKTIPHMWCTSEQIDSANRVWLLDIKSK